MTIANMGFGNHQYRSGKIRVLNVVGTLEFKILDIEVEQRRKDKLAEWGVNTAPPPAVDDSFTWDKFLVNCIIATGADVDEELAKWGTYTSVMWAEDIQPTGAFVVGFINNGTLKVEKVQAIDKFVGKVEYFVISAYTPVT